MFKKLIKIIKIVNSKGVPELPPRETWPIRYLLASEELWALEAILKQIEQKPAETKREVLPTGLSGMLLYRLWQHGFYENTSWDANARCVRVDSTQCTVSSKKSSASQIAERESSVDLRSLNTEENVEAEQSGGTTNSANYTNKKTNCKLHTDELVGELVYETPMRRSQGTSSVLPKNTVSVCSVTSVVSKIIPTLEKQRLSDLAMVAQRKLALEELDKWVVNWNEQRFANDTEKWVKPILIKGGATSKLYFPDESLRLGEDIDVLMPKNMLEDFAGKRVIWATHDCVRKVLANCHFEGHQFTSILDKECNYQNFSKAAFALEGFDTLTVLNNEDNFYVLVNHFVKHRGDSTHDLIDLSFMINKLNIELSLKRFEEKKRLHAPGAINRFCKELYKTGELVSLSEQQVELLAKKLELQICSNFVNELRMADPFRQNYSEGLILGYGFIRKMFHQVFGDIEKTKMYFKKEHSKSFYILMHLTYSPLRRLYQGLFSRGTKH